MDEGTLLTSWTKCFKPRRRSRQLPTALELVYVATNIPELLTSPELFHQVFIASAAKNCIIQPTRELVQ